MPRTPNPKVSVIIPVYNCSQYLGKCLDTVLAQTLRDIEVICVDDGSTDGSREILDCYANDDSRVVVLCEQNSWSGVARNRGMSIARGKYLIFLDADDFFEPQMLEKAYARAKDVDAEVVIFDSDRYIQATSKFAKSTFLKPEMFPKRDVFPSCDIEYNIFNSCMGWAWDKLVNREYIERNSLKFQEKLRLHQDTSFSWMTVLLASRMSLIEETFVHYRIHGGQLSKKSEQSLLAMHDALVDLKRQMLDHGIWREYCIAFANFSAVMIVDAYNALSSGAFKCSIHKLLHESWLDELGIGMLAHDGCDTERMRADIASIESNPPDAYLLDEYLRAEDSVKPLKALIQDKHENILEIQRLQSVKSDEYRSITATSAFRLGRVLASASKSFRGLVHS